MKIRIAGTVNDSIVDGPGIRYTVFFQGCHHNCLGCHNPQTHSFDGGYEIDTDDILKQIKNNPLLDGVTLSGGDPLFQIEGASIIASECKKLGLNVICYTGFEFEKLQSLKNINQLLINVDYLIDGKFVNELRDLSLKYRGSSNQRIIDVKESLKENKVITIEL